MKMGKKVREYKSGDFIFAKVKGYPAWPARVQRQNGKKYFVYFYGTGETANLPPNMIFDYSENKEKFLNKSVKRKDFNDGVKQIEHDFANNVPLEQVVGALAAEAEPAAANNTLNDTADDVADDTLADTTADDTLDERARAGAEAADSDDAGALVIDEGHAQAKGRKSTAKPPATPKAKEAKTPRGRPRKEDKEVKEPEPEEEKKEEEIISRSGRKIRPKRYMDEAAEEPQPSPAAKKRRAPDTPAPPAAATPAPPATPTPAPPADIKAYNTVHQSELRDLKEPFKSADPEKENILITYLPSGQVCGVRLFQARPASFRSDAARLHWDRQAAANAITLKRQLEQGQITPQSIAAQLVTDLNLTEDEKKALDKDRDLELKKARLHFLKTEMKLIELDAKIKTCLSLEKADTELCLKLIDEILELELAALMLLKHPTCMETVKRMRVYVGNAPSWALSEGEALSFGRQAHRIRHKADALFAAMRELFSVPEGVSFWEYFTERVALFKSVTRSLHADKLLEMVHEPIEMSQPSAHSMAAAVAAAARSSDDDDDGKRKATPAKGKKANSSNASTPVKPPLKRQSSKKQQEDKEPEKPTEDTPEPDTNKTNDAEKSDAETLKENDKTDNPKDKSDTVHDKSETDKPNENEPDEADREVEKVNEKSDKNNEKVEKEAENEKAEGDSEKEKDAKEAESNSKEKDDTIESKSNDAEEEKEKTDEKESGDKDKSPKDSKKKESDKTNDKSKDNGKSKDKPKDDKEKPTEKKDDAKNGKDKAKVGEKRKEKSEKEKSEEKEKVEAEEPRAKRSRETKKTEPPPRSPAKRKSKS